jgi:hypothetical protein
MSKKHFDNSESSYFQCSHLHSGHNWIHLYSPFWYLKKVLGFKPSGCAGETPGSPPPMSLTWVVLPACQVESAVVIQKKKSDPTTKKMENFCSIEVIRI